MLDRIDLKIKIIAPPTKLLLQPKPQENSASILRRVMAARAVQYERCNKLNAVLSNSELQKHIVLDKMLQNKLMQWAEKKNISLRSINKIIKVARTIADLEQNAVIGSEHLSEAMAYYE